ncbi:MAG: DUF3298 domain-containing protein [Syntrophomonadaceae bacterium]|jgi:hypothetical protein|nr:DUF3298 domain-containing protein [Syntrophomonadaceae bacterium]
MRKLLAVMLAIGIMLATNVSAALAEDTPAAFTDIKGHWAEKVILEMTQANILQGLGVNENGENVFAPDTPVTKTDAAAAFGQIFQLGAGEIFQDNAGSNGETITYTTYADKGSAPVKSEDYAVSRLETAVAVQNAFTVKGYNAPMIMIMPYFHDTGKLTPEQLNSVIFVNNTNIMKGYNDYFRPDNSLTRAELAQVLSCCQRLVKMNTENVNGGNEDVALETDTVTDKTDRMVTNLSIPVLKNLPSASIQEQVNALWKNEAEKFQQEIAKMAAEDETIDTVEPKSLYEASSTYSLGILKPEFISLYVDYDSYTRGAHGLTERVAYNIDLLTGKQIALSELFVPDFDYKQFINDIIKAEIQANPDNYFTEESSLFFTEIAPEQQYYISANNLVIYFDLYEIAPYAAGIPEFTIPLADLQEKLAIEL